ncbi:MAG: hypothetical protein JSV33_06020 [bacterium]|nr:MAG: hypothetical protein JSV33_06020 [bacterium]
MKILLTGCIAMVLVAVFSTIVHCSDTGVDRNEKTRTHWGKARVQGVLIVPLGDNHVEGWNICDPGWFDFLNFYSTIDAKTAGGAIASFEYVIKRRYGFEISLAYWNNIIDIYFEATGITIKGSPNFIMPILGLNYHILTDAHKDIYGGPICCLGVVATGLGTDIDVSKDIALGLKIGLDYYIKKSWSLGTSLHYIDFGEMDFSVLPPGIEGIVCNNGLFGIGSMNFMSVTIGVGYRF